MDLKVFAALGVFGTCVITALTAQNTVGVRESFEAPADLVAAQMEAVLDDLPVKAAKTGMLSSELVVEAVVRVIESRSLPACGGLVVDPVLAARDGTRLLSEAGLGALRERLLPLAAIATPNLPEAEALTGTRISSQQDARAAAAKLRGLGCTWVLVKGGHLGGPEVCDLLVGPEGEQVLSSPRLPGGPFHGTGCALSAAIAAYLARGEPVPQAVCRAREFVHRLLAEARALGKGALLLHPQPVTATKDKPA